MGQITNIKYIKDKCLENDWEASEITNILTGAVSSYSEDKCPTYGELTKISVQDLLTIPEYSEDWGVSYVNNQLVSINDIEFNPNKVNISIPIVLSCENSNPQQYITNNSFLINFYRLSDTVDYIKSASFPDKNLYGQNESTETVNFQIKKSEISETPGFNLTYTSNKKLKNGRIVYYDGDVDRSETFSGYNFTLDTSFLEFLDFNEFNNNPIHIYAEVETGSSTTGTSSGTIIHNIVVRFTNDTSNAITYHMEYSGNNYSYETIYHGSNNDYSKIVSPNATANTNWNVTQEMKSVITAFGGCFIKIYIEDTVEITNCSANFTGASFVSGIIITKNENTAYIKIPTWYPTYGDLYIDIGC